MNEMFKTQNCYLYYYCVYNYPSSNVRGHRFSDLERPTCRQRGLSRGTRGAGKVSGVCSKAATFKNKNQPQLKQRLGKNVSKPT